MNKKIILLESAYLPPICYFSCLSDKLEIMLESNEYYEKQTYRNRAYILGPHRVEMLTIPVMYGNQKQLIKDIRPDESQKWQQHHWRTIQTAYGKAPFYEFFADYLQKSYQKKYTFLWDFNYDLLTTCLKLLKLKPTICQTETYEKVYAAEILDIRGMIFPQNTDFKALGYQESPYRQNFGNNFVGNLSIIDLLFCKGNESSEILKKSNKN